MEEDWRDVSDPGLNHKFYVLPPKRFFAKLVRGEDVVLPDDFDFLLLEKRRAKRGYVVETYAVPIARKETSENDPQPGLLLVKLVYSPEGVLISKYYSIVKFKWADILKLKFLLDKLMFLADNKHLWGKLRESTVTQIANRLANPKKRTILEYVR